LKHAFVWISFHTTAGFILEVANALAIWKQGNDLLSVILIKNKTH